MKYLKIKENVLEQILAGKLDHLLLVDDKDDISVNDEVELFNESNVAFGKALVNKITVLRFSDLKNNNEELTSELEESYDDMSFIKEGSHIKVVNFEFQKYEDPKSISRNTNLETDSVKIYADGGSRGNPGPSASGYVIMTMEDQLIKSNGVYLGITTNNQAEYKALKFALEDATELGAKRVTVFMDSMLVVNQLNGSFKIKKMELIPIYQSIKELSKNFEDISFTHVPRELNKLADAEVNKCLDAYS